MRILLTLVLACALACGGAPENPEDQVRAVITELQRASEARDVDALKDHLSETYKDAQGNDRRAVMALATGHFMRNKAVYTLGRVREVEILEPGFARAEAIMAIAGTPITDVSLVPQVNGDLYRFDLRFRDEGGTWRLTAAAWSPATPADFE